MFIVYGNTINMNLANIVLKIRYENISTPSMVEHVEKIEYLLWKLHSTNVVFGYVDIWQCLQLYN